VVANAPDTSPYTGHVGPVAAVAYAPDGATLAAGGDDGTARIWDTETGQQRQQLIGHDGPVLSIAYAPDGATLATGGIDRTARIWDTRTGQQRQQLTGQTDQGRAERAGSGLGTAPRQRRVRQPVTARRRSIRPQLAGLQGATVRRRAPGGLPRATYWSSRCRTGVRPGRSRPGSHLPS
jgi:hypothetical protein